MRLPWRGSWRGERGREGEREGEREGDRECVFYAAGTQCIDHVIPTD